MTIQKTETEIMNTNLPINVGLIGFGTIGTGVVKYFLDGRGEPSNIRLARVVDSDLARPRELSFPQLTDRVEDILEDPAIHVVVELIGGENPAKEFMLKAMEQGKSVVTANKAVLSRHMKTLFTAARKYSVDLAFEASVAASIPIIRVLRGFRGERITKLSGILNGTSNYILSQMERGLDFDAALQLATEKGFAELNHSLDTGGGDARDKLAIISSLLYDSEIKPENIYCEGITSITSVDLDFAAKYGVEEGEPGYSIKSLATVQMSQDRLEMNVFPALISKRHPLASVRDELNAIYLEGELSGPQFFQGKGAGREATTSAIVSNILRVADNIRQNVTDGLPRLESKVTLEDDYQIARKGYVRINLKHVPGSIAEASAIMAKYGFNIEDFIQRRRFQSVVNDEVVIPDIVTVEPLSFSTLEQALLELEQSDRVDGKPFFLRFKQ
jgi:homoserine dehydrogenase